MRGEIVENDDVALAERWYELGFDPGIEDAPVHRLIDDKGRGQSMPAQAGDEGLGFPVSERSLGPQAPALKITAPHVPQQLGKNPVLWCGSLVLGA